MPVLLVAAGGTIASRPGPDGGVAGVLTGADLLARAGLDGGGIDVVDAARGASWSFTVDAIEGLARLVVAASDAGTHDGVVVTHGTDTIEETAFLAWLLGGAAAARRCPIVFTGAMHHDAHPEPDGPANLRAAVELAGGGPLDGGGPVLHLAGTTHHARWATKTDTSALDTFASPGAGPVQDPPPAGPSIEPAVVQVTSHIGVDPGLVEWHLQRGARGVVVEGTGAGNVHASLVPGIEAALAAAVPVVVTSRCWTGSVSPTYGTPGGGHHLAALGCIHGGDLPTHKARLALSVALGRDADPDAVRRWFDALLGGRAPR